MPGLAAQKGNTEPTPSNREVCNEYGLRILRDEDVLWTTEESVDVAEMTTRRYERLASNRSRSGRVRRNAVTLATYLVGRVTWGSASHT